MMIFGPVFSPVYGCCATLSVITRVVYLFLCFNTFFDIVAAYIVLVDPLLFIYCIETVINLAFWVT